MSNQEMSNEYHGHPKFREYLKEMEEIHSRKNHDYADQQNPLSNFMTTSELIKGIPDSPFKIALSRMIEKVLRICQIAKKGNKVNENMQDTLMDLAVYSLLCRILWEEDLAEKEYCPYRESGDCYGGHCDTCTLNK